MSHCYRNAVHARNPQAATEAEVARVQCGSLPDCSKLAQGSVATVTGPIRLWL